MNQQEFELIKQAAFQRGFQKRALSGAALDDALAAALIGGGTLGASAGVNSGWGAHIAAILGKDKSGFAGAGGMGTLGLAGGSLAGALPGIALGTLGKSPILGGLAGMLGGVGGGILGAGKLGEWGYNKFK